MGKSLDENRGERAELRRCEMPGEILLAKAFHRLCRILPQWEKLDLLALTVVAGVLAHVKTAGGGPFPARPCNGRFCASPRNAPAG